MDLGLLAAVAMLVVWAGLTFFVNDAPGLTHALLVAGVSLVIWRVVRKDEKAAPPPPPKN